MKTISAGDLLELSVSERLLLVEDIWDSVASVPESLPLTDKQRKELNRRLQAYHDNPEAGSPWEEIKAHIMRKIKC